PVNIYELGLIYDIKIAPDGVVTIVMTLTSPMCPVAGSLPPDVEARIRAIPGVKDARVEVTWEPPWGPDKMTEAAQLQLNMLSGRLYLRPMFSRRLPWPSPENRLARLLKEKQRGGVPILDLTESNPTRIGLAYPAEAIGAALASTAASTYRPEPRGL